MNYIRFSRESAPLNFIILACDNAELRRRFLEKAPPEVRALPMHNRTAKALTLAYRKSAYNIQGYYVRPSWLDGRDPLTMGEWLGPTIIEEANIETAHADALALLDLWLPRLL